MSRRTVDPTGKAALFGSQVAAAPDQITGGPHPYGKEALFSSPGRRAGTVVVECSRCGARTRVSYVDLGLRLALGSVWIPLQRHQHWMRCPSCERRRWCRIGWNE